MNERQKKLRLDALELIRAFGEGHSGRALSAIDLMEALYFGEENGRQIFAHNPNKPQWDGRDYFVLSKKEALPALYAVLKMNGYKLPQILPHLPDRRVPGVELSTKEHAYGISYAVGMAEVIKAEKRNQHVFCLAGDYELDHGEAWEAIALAAERRLDRLCLILDENDPRDIDIQGKFEAFGWRVVKLRDAHDHDEIAYGYMKARITQRKPACVWAPTKKSAGIPFAERKPEYDDVVYSDAEMREAISILS